ncbi:acetate--CoA ligase family protein [Agrobacterium rhizogenes]|uniref:acetate--CoA ligase family protein n=1 Tax=Rhizobium rhizogenes TaxID=359 RepID=UPI000645C5F0|nr:acetate--CoA ligase family protein [Rhizobium rhizogenes]NTG90512.1 acetate--CoA ligase family protein [Rhizobium rhizogenes]NTH21123.1 acetate--CoA ligase family protein [Rhizobium rhizogenes]NTH34136.1 acetate--CoA ligase family protein [Rhizobium rhizogenes]NTI19823.1 acetate--CoA ligase family protein [Rhizobium rhizogenes]QRM40687.1 acetate--CoA ligase family protein [Rhizobium rhizogenes]
MTVEIISRLPSTLPGGSMERLLRPRSVAIVGASDRPGSLGASVLSNLDRSGYAGVIHLINPKRTEIGDRPCLASIEDLPDGVDAAVLAVPRAAVLGSIEALARRRVGATIIFSAGFAEGGEEGLADQREIARIAAEVGMVIEGPNCLGMVNHVDRIPLTFIETSAEELGERPGIAIVSQSGAMAAVLGVTFASRDLGLSYSISTGNEAASGLEDYVEFLVEDTSTRVIAMIVEQFRKPARFLAAARKASAKGKRIVLLHPGRSSAARESAATHTGAMAGDYQVMRAKVARAGIILAETLEELGDIAEIALRCPMLPAGGPAVLGESGAFKALTLDLCEELGLDLPSIDDETAPALRAVLPPFVGVSNPLDLTAQGLVEPDLYERTLTALFDDARFASIVACIIQTDPVTSAIKLPPILKAVREHKPEKPLIFAGLDEGAPIPVDYIAQLRALGIVYFPSTERAFRALKRIDEFAGRDVTASTAPPVAIVGFPLQGGVIPEYRAKQILAPLGIPFPEGRLATTLEQALAAAAAVGYPVVLKAQSPDLSHKSDAGGVVIGLADAASLKEGWVKLHADIARHRPNLILDGVLIEAMGKRGIELIIGARNDPDWGPVILAGFGGVAAEILRDVRILTPDLLDDAIIRELYRLKNAPLLRGFRGSQPLDVGAAARIIATLSRLLLAEPTIREIDLNPVVIYPDGEGAIALDALILTAPVPADA